MGLGTGATAAIVGGISAAGSVASAAIGSHGANEAASKQVAQQEKALDYEKSTSAPYISLGDTSAAKLEEGIKNGTFGTPSSFTAPTADEARNTPGYEFALEQGNKGILAASAASGGAISGGTAKSLANFDTGLADSTYTNRFNQALQTYQASLTGQNQAYQQLFQPTQLGAGTAVQSASQVGSTLGNIGNAQAAGIVGSTNAITSGLTNGTNSISQALLLSQLFGGSGTAGGSGASPQTSNALGLTSPASSFAVPQIPGATLGNLPSTFKDYASAPG